MSYSSDETNEFVPLPIVQAARRTADYFARQQPTPEKAEQVRLNTLAVWVVNDYLQLMGIPTSLSAGDSWNSVTRLCADVADLEVSGIGRLECRPVTAQAKSCAIPLEVWQDRIGYVAVHIDEAQQEAQVLGFTPMPAVQVSLSQLRSPEALLDRLDQLKQVTSEAASNNVDLSRWLNGLFGTGWQTLESLLAPAQLAFQFRSQTTIAAESQPLIRRAKLIELGRQLESPDQGIAIILTLEVIPPSEQDAPSPETEIRLQAHPFSQPALPTDLQLTVLDASGNVFLEAASSNGNDYLQLEFSGQPDESFSVRVAFGSAEVRENFVI